MHLQHELQGKHSITELPVYTSNILGECWKVIFPQNGILEKNKPNHTLVIGCLILRLI